MQRRNVLIAIIIALAMPFAIQAKGGQQKALAETETTAETTALTVEKQKAQPAAKKCETIQTKLETKITRFENSKQKDQKVFGNLR